MLAGFPIGGFNEKGRSLTLYSHLQNSFWTLTKQVIALPINLTKICTTSMSSHSVWGNWAAYASLEINSFQLTSFLLVMIPDDQHLHQENLILESKGEYSWVSRTPCLGPCLRFQKRNAVCRLFLIGLACLHLFRLANKFELRWQDQRGEDDLVY